MTRDVFIKEFMLAGMIFILASCNEGKKNTAVQNETTAAITTGSIKKDSAVTNKTISITDTTLKVVSINENYFNQKTAASALINRDLFDSLGLAKIPAPAGLQKDSSFKIKIIDTLIANDKTKLLLASVESENEHWAWLLVYDKNNKVIKTEKLFYEDFVEYFSRTTTEVTNNKILITTETEGEEGKNKTVKKYVFKHAGQLEQVK